MTPLLTRREMVAAVGTGLLVGACRRDEPIEQVAPPPPGRNVSIEIHGPFILRQYGGISDVFIPMAAGNTMPGGMPGKPHHARLGFFKEKKTSLPAGSMKSYRLAGGDIELTGKVSHGSYKQDFPDLIKMKDALPLGAELRTYKGSASPAFSCRIRLVGGKLETIVDKGAGEWAIPAFDGTSSRKIKPVIGLTWHALQPKVRVVQSGGESLGNEITMVDYPFIAIANAATPPEEWWPEKRPTPELKEVDHHFKWLYAIHTPDGTESGPDPWKEPLPAPKCVSVVTVNDAERAHTVGSSTCFGGEG